MNKFFFVIFFLVLSSCSSLDKFKPFSCVMKKNEVIEHTEAVVNEVSTVVLKQEDTIVVYRNTVFMYSNYLEKEADLLIELGLYDEAFNYLNMSFNGLVYLIELNEDDEYLIKSLSRVYSKIKAYYSIKLENALMTKELENKINKIPFNR